MYIFFNLFPLSPFYRFSLLILFYLEAFVSTAQTPPLRFFNVGEKQGLGGVKPTCVYQDTYGFIWIGTWGGLYRFDGYSYRLFEYDATDSASIPDNFIAYHQIYEDIDHNLWIPTFYEGFVRFNRKTERFDRFPSKKHAVSPKALNALYGDKNGDIWLGTRNAGLFHYMVKKDTFIHYDTKYANIGNHLLSVSQDVEGHIWFGTEKGAAVLDPKMGNILRTYTKGGKDGFKRNHKRELCSDYIIEIFKKGKYMWLCSKYGLNRVYQDSVVHYVPTDSPGIPDAIYNEIQRIWPNGDSSFWVGTLGGLLHFDASKGVFEIPKDEDAHNISVGGIHGISPSKDGNLWLSGDLGLYLMMLGKKPLCNPNWCNPVQKILPSSPLLYGGPHLAQAGNRLFVGSEKGLYVVNTNDPRVNTVEVLKDKIYALFTDKDGRLFAGTKEGSFFVLDANSHQNPKKEALNAQNIKENERVTCFAQDRTGSIWVGTSEALYRKDGRTGKYASFQHDPKNQKGFTNHDITDLQVDGRGDLWIGTIYGLYKVTAEAISRLENEGVSPAFERYVSLPNDSTTLSNNHVRDIFNDHNGRLWVGTDAGLNLYEPGSPQKGFKRFFKDQGLPENKIAGILEDKKHNIWVSTLNGKIAQYHQGSFRQFSPSKGLDVRCFITSANLSLPDGTLMFAGVGGLMDFHPDSIQWAPDTAGLHIVSLRLFDSELPIDTNGILKVPAYMAREIKLEYDQNVLSVEVAALNYTNPEKQEYRYKLEGFGTLEHWQYLGKNRKITLTNLFPGTYTLYVESTTMPGEREHWESRRQLIIRVGYPWGRIFLYTFLILAVLYIVYRIRLRGKLAVAETEAKARLAQAEAKRREELAEVEVKLAQSEAKYLQERNEERSRIYTNITHEFRTPLTVILGMAKKIRSDSSQWLDKGLNMIQRNGQNLLHLVNQMLDLAKLEAGEVSPKFIHGNIIVYLKYLSDSFDSYAESKGIGLHFLPEREELHMDYDPDKTLKIVSNLLSNAIKFTPDEGEIYLQISKPEAGFLPITVRDTGIGIPEDKLPLIFERFYQADDSSTRQGEGTGIGLTLVKELVKVLNGRIEVKSTVEKGSVFTFWLPILHTASPESVLPTRPSIKQENQSSIPQVEEGTKPYQPNLPSVLIVEDNEDVILYLSDCLAGRYRITVARDGQEGIEKAIAEVPDIILSDVMMPRKDGFALCDTLKNDEITDHIPIVLLTAKADADSRMSGLRQGADAYLDKPFNEEELLVVMEKLLELRQKLQDKYSKLFEERQRDTRTSEPENVPEDTFILKVKTLIEKYIDDETLGVTKLCKLLHIGRTQLHNKIKALTCMSTTELIRSIRIAKAKYLLVSTDWSISKIANHCGFYSEYFTRVFTKIVGCSPTEYRERNRKR